MSFVRFYLGTKCKCSEKAKSGINMPTLPVYCANVLPTINAVPLARFANSAVVEMLACSSRMGGKAVGKIYSLKVCGMAALYSTKNAVENAISTEEKTPIVGVNRANPAQNRARRPNASTLPR
jgi:hypothetical protein